MIDFEIPADLAALRDEIRAFVVEEIVPYERDPRIPRATQKFEVFVLEPANGLKFGLLNAGAMPDAKDQQAVIGYDCVTGLTGRALADMIQPGVDADWR